MTQMPTNYLDFACFLHNSFDPKYMTKEEKTAVLCHTRSRRFVDKPSMELDIKSFLDKYLSSKKEQELLKNGLNHYYNIMKNDIKNQNNIGLIIYGAYHIKLNTDKDLFICNYTTQYKKSIRLTINSICQAILKQFTYEEIKTCCKNTPNFNMYSPYVE